MFQDKVLLEQKLYLAGLVFAVLSIIGIALPIPRCDFNLITGLYCPGCGGTRAVIAFLNGRWFKSFLYHPFVPYFGILYIVFMIRGTLAVLAKERFHYMKFRNSYIFLGIAIILIQFVVKNMLLLIYGIDILQNYKI